MCHVRYWWPKRVWGGRGEGAHLALEGTAHKRIFDVRPSQGAMAPSALLLGVGHGEQIFPRPLLSSRHSVDPPHGSASTHWHVNSPDARETSPSRKTCTMAPHEAASNPRSDISMEVTGLGVMYECSGRYVRTSQTFSVPSRPAVARYLPPRSMTRSHTGPLWQSILATGSPRFGVQSVTVPFE
eukprot:scaffold116543_cov28-Tisochrysis_lutea.AAC.4